MHLRSQVEVSFPQRLSVWMPFDRCLDDIKSKIDFMKNGTWRLLKLQNWQIKAGFLALPRLTNLAVSYHCSKSAGLLVKNAATWKKHNCYCLGCRAEWWKAKLSPYCLIISPPVPWVICIVVTWQIKAVLEVTVYKWLVLQTADGGYHREQERYREWEREKEEQGREVWGTHCYKHAAYQLLLLNWNHIHKHNYVFFQTSNSQ